MSNQSSLNIKFVVNVTSEDNSILFSPGLSGDTVDVVSVASEAFNEALSALGQQANNKKRNKKQTFPALELKATEVTEEPRRRIVSQSVLLTFSEVRLR